MNDVNTHESGWKRVTENNRKKEQTKKRTVSYIFILHNKNTFIEINKIIKTIPKKKKEKNENQYKKNKKQHTHIQIQKNNTNRKKQKKM